MVESVDDLDLTPPKAAQENAQKVLDWRDEHGEDVNGMTRTGWVRANQLADGEELSPDIISRMASFNRHRSNSDIADEYEGEPWKDAGYVAWQGWGGDEGIDWAMRMSDRIDSIENTGKDKITTLSHKHDEETVENRNLVGEMMGGSDNTQSISKNTLNGYLQDAPEFEDQNWEDAVSRLSEVHGIVRSYITSVVRHEASGHEREENVPPFEDPIDTDTLNQFADNVENNVDDETYSDLIKQIVDLDESVRKIFYDTVVHHNNMHGDNDIDVSQLLNEDLEKGVDYDTMPQCMAFHVQEKDMDTDQAFAVCSSEFDVSKENKEDIIDRMGEPAQLEEDPSTDDKVRWDASGGNTYGVVDTVERDGTVSAEPEGPDMEGSEDEPAYKVQVYDIEDGEWSGTETYVVHRGDALTVIEDFPESRSNSERLQQGIIPTHRPLGDISTKESNSWSRPSSNEFQSSYGFEEKFADLGVDDKRKVAAHFGRVDNSSYDDATYSDLQLPHHHPDSGDVDRAAVMAARQRLPQSDMPQEDLEAIDTHLANHLRNDFGEEDVEDIIEKENAVERQNVYEDADKAVAKARKMGITGIHTMKEEDRTLYRPGATPEDFEQARRENSESLSEGQLVSFETDYGRSFGRVKDNEKQNYEVEVYNAELGGGWKSSGRSKTLKQKELELENKFPDSLDDVFNNGSSADAETVEEKEEQLSENGFEEDDGEGEEVTEQVNPSEVQQVKKKVAQVSEILSEDSSTDFIERDSFEVDSDKFEEFLDSF